MLQSPGSTAELHDFPTLILVELCLSMSISPFLAQLLGSDSNVMFDDLLSGYNKYQKTFETSMANKKSKDLQDGSLQSRQCAPAQTHSCGFCMCINVYQCVSMCINVYLYLYLYL